MLRYHKARAAVHKVFEWVNDNISLLAMYFNVNKSLYLNLGANSFVFPPKGEHEDDKPIDL